MKNISKLLVVSNRLPLKVEFNDVDFSLKNTSGGLQSALHPLQSNLEFKWVGWPGAPIPHSLEQAFQEKLAQEFNGVPINLTRTEEKHFYHGFCNRVLWPLFHYMPNHVDFSLPNWNEYVQVNHKFAEKISGEIDDQTMIWVHDYHLFLLPKILRERFPNASIGFFLHIPFPSSEIYRLLPVRRELLEGVLGADLIGFHTLDYARHFASSCLRVLGLQSNRNQIAIGDRSVKYGAYPIGVSTSRLTDAQGTPEYQAHEEHFKSTFKGKKVILGVDRLDYIKGLPQKLDGFEAFLEENPDLGKDTILLQVVVPSRTDVPEYQDLQKDVEQRIAQINGKHGDGHHVPIHYIAKGISFSELVAWYALADACLITSVRDGMNLVSMEYIACQRKGKGVLLLSEFTGSAQGLGEAIFLNPWDRQSISAAIKDVWTLTDDEKRLRLTANHRFVQQNSAETWAENFISDLGDLRFKATEAPAFNLRKHFLSLRKAFRDADKRWMVLDYDGTLREFTERPQDAHPSPEILSLLERMASQQGTHVCIVSGRRQADLEDWFGDRPFYLGAEHGLFLKRPHEPWSMTLKHTSEWKDAARDLLSDFAERTAGSFIEEKNMTIAWHYRNADDAFGNWQAHELLLNLDGLTRDFDIQVLAGNKVIELRPMGVHKGLFIETALADDAQNPDVFTFCAGDDKTDEDMFKVLPKTAWSCRIGRTITKANYYLNSQAELIDVLEEIFR